MLSSARPPPEGLSKLLGPKQQRVGARCRVPPAGELGASVGEMVVSVMLRWFRRSAPSMPDLRRSPTTREPRVLPTFFSPHPPLPFYSSFILSAFLLSFFSVASYNTTLGQGLKAALEAE